MNSKNENINKNENMTYEERIDFMKKNHGLKFVEIAKTIIKNGKVIKGEEARENFNTEVNSLTFEIEELYPLDYEEFKKEFPKTIELVETVKGGIVVDSVKKGLVLQGWTVETNVKEVINNIKNNVKNPKEAEEAIKLREEVLKETKVMKEKFDFEWNQDLFWKAWKIKEGEARWKYLVNYKGEKIAKKTIDDIKNIGGLEFIEALQKEVYGDN